MKEKKVSIALWIACALLVIVAAGSLVYAVSSVGTLRTQNGQLSESVSTLQQQLSDMTDEKETLTQEREEALSQVDSVRDELSDVQDKYDTLNNVVGELYSHQQVIGDDSVQLLDTNLAIYDSQNTIADVRQLTDEFESQIKVAEGHIYAYKDFLQLNKDILTKAGVDVNNEISSATKMIEAYKDELARIRLLLSL